MVLFSDWAPDRRPLSRFWLWFQTSFAENPGHSLKHQTSSRNLQPYVTMCNHGSASSNEAQKGPFGSLRHIDRGRTSAERLLCCHVPWWTKLPSFCHSWPWSLLEASQTSLRTKSKMWEILLIQRTFSRSHGSWSCWCSLAWRSPFLFIGQCRASQSPRLQMVPQASLCCLKRQCWVGRKWQLNHFVWRNENMLVNVLHIYMWM